ncbi:MAG: glycosyltransferase family 2 protein [Clostridia bacterium]|nr:glycosyltransferase family 2 protein [Clostridia bacterium]
MQILGQLKERNIINNLIEIENNENLGFSAAVNQGIKLAKGEYIFLLNNDVELERNCLEKLHECIEKDKSIFSVQAKMIQYYNRNKIDDAGDQYTILGWAFKTGDGDNIEKYNKTGEIFSSCAGAALYRKELFEKIGYFDEAFFAYMEDVDIGYRARVYGYKNVFCPSAMCYHVGSATSGSKYNNFKIRLAARNNIYVPYKNMPFLQLVLNLPFIIFGFIVKVIFFGFKGYGRVYLLGICEGFRTLHKIKRIKHRLKYLKNYVSIQRKLIKNTWDYLIIKLFKNFLRLKNRG